MTLDNYVGDFSAFSNFLLWWFRAIFGMWYELAGEIL
jgi:hypothetical protein